MGECSGSGMGVGGDWWVGGLKGGGGVAWPGRAGGPFEDKGVSGRRGGRGGCGEEWAWLMGLGGGDFCYVLNVSGRMIIGR